MISGFDVFVRDHLHIRDIYQLITSAREDGVPEEETREKLKRRNAVRKKSSSDAVVQVIDDRSVSVWCGPW